MRALENGTWRVQQNVDLRLKRACVCVQTFGKLPETDRERRSCSTSCWRSSTTGTPSSRVWMRTDSGLSHVTYVNSVDLVPSSPTAAQNRQTKD